MTFLFLDVNAATCGERAAFLRQQEGWKVFAFQSLKEARAWLASASELDLVITEAILNANETGFSLREEALRRFPNARVLFTTRYDLSGFEDQVGGWPVLQDGPYTLEKLLSKIQTTLTQPPPWNPEPPLTLQPGTILGSYQILDRLTSEEESETYRAIQMTVQRPVALVLMRPELQALPRAVEEFKARERLKASLSHPRIAPLYEAGSVNGLIFYSRELPRGRSLEEIQNAGEHLSERRITEILWGVSEAMLYGVEKGHYHRRLTARDIYVDGENQASIVNLFRPATSKTRTPREEVHALLQLMRPVAAEGKAKGLLASLSEQEHDWAGLLDELDDVRGAMRERSIMRRIEAEEGRNPQSRQIPWWLWALGGAALVAVAALGALSGTPRSANSSVQKQEMIRIPTGPYLYQKNAKRSLPDFWISKYEVTVGQYAEFLKALGKPPAKTWDHPDQPLTKASHIPAKWAEYYAAAKAGATFNGQPISLNTPVAQVDWWDAYAYARWRGQRLPTEEEWEKAARGIKGFVYPWGNQPVGNAANLGDDYDARSPQGGSKDGYNFWAPTDRDTKDISPYGVCDMAGNVAEWTASEATGEPWPAHPDYPDIRVPVVRGGHFAMPSSANLLTSRHFPESANESTLARGFRTASDVEPSAPASTDKKPAASR